MSIQFQSPIMITSTDQATWWCNNIFLKKMLLININCNSNNKFFSNCTKLIGIDTTGHFSNPVLTKMLSSQFDLLPRGTRGKPTINDLGELQLKVIICSAFTGITKTTSYCYYTNT